MNLRLAAAFVPLLLAGCGKPEPDAMRAVAGPTMGTTWSLRGTCVEEWHRALVQDHLDKREAVFSHWREDSALSRFNAHTGTAWFPVPAELVGIVAKAREIAAQTHDVLDITCAPLVEAWGFGKNPSDAPPDDATLARLREHCGWRHLEWRHEPPALRKTRPEVRINVASVAEGFVMDEIITRLRGEGLRDFLLEVGGEVAASGQPPGGGPWHVGVQAPGAEAGQPLQTLKLRDQCAATSGTYRHFKQGAPRIHHLLDPRTGRPAAHSLASVTVLHPSAFMADGYATALLILGPEQGRRIAARLGLHVIWIERD